jgi:hypothetical protein
MTGSGRVYLPLTWELLAELDRAGEVVPPVEPVLAQEMAQEMAQAMTQATGQGDEEAEYAALQHAADLSAGLLEGPGRRVVVVAELAGDGAAVPLRRVVAVHVDDAAIDPAYLTDDGVREPPDLGWWATQELPALLGRGEERTATANSVRK